MIGEASAGSTGPERNGGHAVTLTVKQISMAIASDRLFS